MIENIGLNPHLDRMGWSAFFQKQLDSVESEDIPARVVGVRRNFFLVSQGEGEILTSLAAGIIKNPEARYPAVGDWVLVRDTIITAVLSRKNTLSRLAAGGRHRKKGQAAVSEQVIAANLDTTFIVCGLDRDFNLGRIERYITMVYNCGITPVVILTKADLHQSPENAASEVENIAIGVPVHLVSANTDIALSEFKDNLSSGKTVALIGSSGAGKSTLINRLYGQEIQATASVSASLGKGKHTTTNRDLILLPQGGMMIDNPGIREIALGTDNVQTESAFPEIETLSESCKFPDCSHTHEPGCRVLEAVLAGEITQARLMSFQKIKSELDYYSHREKKGASRVEKERWKWVSEKAKAINKQKKNG